MINNIEINIQNYNLIIDNNHCIINNTPIPIKTIDIDNIIGIIRNWNPNYYNNKIIGEDNYFIKIHYNNKINIYKFKNDYPSNFKELTNYVGEMYDRIK